MTSLNNVEANECASAMTIKAFQKCIVSWNNVVVVAVEVYMESHY